MRRSIFAALCVALVGCGIPVPVSDTGPASMEDVDSGPPPFMPSARRLVLQGCGGFAPDPAFVGPWVFRIESAAVVEGAGSKAQNEWVTRYGVAELCQDGNDLQMRVLTCLLTQSPIYQLDALTCSAQLPNERLLEALPGTLLGGQFTANGIGGQIALSEWIEQWGLEEGVEPPAEPAGITMLEEAPGVIDQDDDGAPGVTLRGDGAVPTITWAARSTRMNIVLEILDERTLVGITNTQTQQTILGGPATRTIRGRTRANAVGNAVFFRADGLFETPLLDANGDGALDCTEVVPFIGPILAGPRNTDACRR